MKKKKFTLTLKHKNWFQKFCTRLVHFILNKNWSGATIFPHELVQIFGKIDAKKIKAGTYHGKNLDSIIAKYRRDVKLHFKHHDWKLDLDYFQHEIIRDFFDGANVHDYISAKLTQGLGVDELLAKDGPFLIKRKP